MNVQYIFSLKLCGYLCLMGFPVKGVRSNAKVPNKSVYIFERTPRLDECIKQYDKDKCTKEKINDYFKNCESTSKS